MTIAGDAVIAQVTAGNVTLSPRSTSDLSLVGRLIPQNSSNGLAAVSDIFNNFVAGKQSDVIVQGDSVGPGTVSHYRTMNYFLIYVTFKDHMAQQWNQVTESGSSIA